MNDHDCAKILEYNRQNIRIERKYLNETINIQAKEIQRLRHIVDQYESIIETLNNANKQRAI